MADDPRIERILDAAYSCFARHGVRRTTMDDIAAAAEMSRAAVYQYVHNKDDIFRRLSSRLFDAALAQARAAAAREGPVADRLHGALSVKVELVLRLMAQSPHAEELLGASARASGDLYAAFSRSLHELVTALVAAAQARGEVRTVGVEPSDIADLALALPVGLEATIADPDVIRRRLRQGVELLCAGLTAPVRPAQPVP